MSPLILKVVLINIPQGLVFNSQSVQPLFVALFKRLKQSVHRTVENVGFQAIQLVSIGKSYRERRDKDKLRQLATTTKEFNLSEEQVNAATSHFKETLVIAGAGSGKTSVLIGRAKYLIEFNRASGDGILMLADNRDAAKELSERAEESGIDVTAQTFHAFGNSVIRELVPIKEYEEFKNLNEYAAYVRATVPRTLMDKQVKSHGEWLKYQNINQRGAQNSIDKAGSSFTSFTNCSVGIFPRTMENERVGRQKLQAAWNAWKQWQVKYGYA